ncbi:hypothetical protein HELRODRAFT_159597 [Helobdella robusta]|uniref:Centrosomal protein of 89 kDa n=1 Tax=Helobdella robusta TaxID=6412 RepID=T1EP80_HELRO|nr:hypothetical protein HELRODRAFT_159597 [Helobdella robusta]ESO13002.1 hypothetical protein HELRODRAFT_159597 [Helobdella robusta]
MAVDKYYGGTTLPQIFPELPKPISPDDTDSSLIEYQNARPSEPYTGELIITQTRTHEKSTSATFASPPHHDIDDILEKNNKNIKSNFNDQINNKFNDALESNLNKDKNFKSDNLHEDDVIVPKSLSSSFKQPVHETDVDDNKFDKVLNETNGNVINDEDGINDLVNKNITKNYDTNLKKKSLPAKKVHYDDDDDEDGKMTLKSDSSRDDEIKKLKFLIHKLNVQLDRYQRKYTPMHSNKNYGEGDHCAGDSVDINDGDGLPLKGPKPKWLINTKQLVPLLLAYDEQLKEKDDIINRHKEELNSFRADLGEIITENERLHIQIEQSNNADENISMNQQKELRKQCSLVLEENELLLMQLSLLKQKEQKIIAEANEKILDLKSKLSSSSKAQETLSHDNKQLLKKLTELSKKYDDVVTTYVSHNEHIETIRIVKEKTKSVLKSMRLHDRKRFDNQNKFKNLLVDLLNTAQLTALERDKFKVLVKDYVDNEHALKDVMDSQINSLKKAKSNLKENLLKKKRTFDKVSRKIKNKNEQLKTENSRYEREVEDLKKLLNEKNHFIENTLEQNRNISKEIEIISNMAWQDNDDFKRIISEYQTDIRTTANIEI